VPAFWRSQRC